MITFIGGYVVGMAAALLAVMFFTGVKRGNAAYDKQTAAIEGRLADHGAQRRNAANRTNRRVKRERAARAAVRRETVEF